MNRLLVVMIAAAIVSACLSIIFAYGAWRLVYPPKARTLHLGPTTGTSLRPSHTVGGIQFYHYVERRNAANSGPAEEGR